MKYKVAQIIPYFGKWPEWIELYFYSCGRNSMVDFIYYTDCPLPKHRYKNTIFHQCTFEEYKQFVGERLGVEYNPAKAYKLTDLKPFLGAVHAPELNGYDFWGFGDLDVVHGDLSMLINDDMLEKYDVITTHAFRVAGHFTICRNNNYYRNLCFKISGWEKGLSEDKHHGYDEMAWSNLINPYQRNIDRLYRYLIKYFYKDINSYKGFMNSLLNRRKYIKECNTTPNPQPHEECIPVWTYNLKDGKLTMDKGIELPYLHFMCFKKNIWMKSEIYWREGYYQLDYDFDQYSKITFDYEKIKGHDKE